MADQEEPTREKNEPTEDPYQWFPTPQVVAEAAIGLLSRPINNRGANIYVLDPGAGTGVWGQAAKNVLGDDTYIAGIEIQTTMPKVWPYDLWQHKDFLALDAHSFYPYTYVVGNPPYDLAEAFVRKGLEFLEPGGQLLYLMPLSFLASQSRGAGLFREFPPDKVWVCSRRISFYTSGKTAPKEYAMYRWTNYRDIDRTELRWWDYMAPVSHLEPVQQLVVMQTVMPDVLGWGQDETRTEVRGEKGGE